MEIVVFITFISVVISLILTPLFGKLAHILGVVDRPDHRKIHQKPVAYLGGLSFFFTFFSSILLAFLLKPELFSIDLIKKFGLVFSCSTVIVLMGIVDDILGLKATVKLLIEFGIGFAMFYFGDFQIEAITIPFGGAVHLNNWSWVLTLLWFASIMNAVNLSDGLDGLAGGICLFGSISMGAIFFKNGNISMMLFCFVLAGSILGFLKYNFNPASIFMGDTGSLLLGYLIATAALWARYKTSSFIALFVPMVAMMMPILDAGLAVVRRLVNKQHPFKPDKKHLHHRLMELGLTHKQVVLFIYFLSIYFGVMAFVMAFIPITYVIPLVMLLILFLIGLYWMLVYLENHIVPMLEEQAKSRKKRKKK